MDWNDTGTAYPADQTIPRLFEQQLAANPHAVALVFGVRSLNYDQLNSRANQLAHWLRSLGVGPEDRAAVCLERSIELVVALLAILKAGGAYVPLDPGYPDERLGFMLADSQASVLITDSTQAHRFTNFRGLALALDGQAALIDQQPTANLPCSSGPLNLAYLMYTSGSTGIPKAIAIDHRAILRLAFASNYLELDQDDVVAQASSASFDAMTFELWATLLAGATVVGIERDVDWRLRTWRGHSNITRSPRSFSPPPSSTRWPASFPPRLGTLTICFSVGSKSISSQSDSSWARVRRGTCSTFMDQLNAPRSPPIRKWNPSIPTNTQCPSANRSPTQRPMFSALTFTPCPSGSKESCISEETAWHVGITTGRRSRPSGSCPIPSAIVAASDCTAPATLSAGEATERSSFEVASTSRSSFGGSGSSWAKSSPCSPRTRPCVNVPWSRVPTPGTSNGLWPTSCPTGLRGWRRPVGSRTYRQLECALRRPLREGTGTTGRRLRHQRLEQQLHPRLDSPGPDAFVANSDRGSNPVAKRRRVWELGCGTGLLLLELAAHASHYLGTDFSAKALSELATLVQSRGLHQVHLERRLADNFEGIEPAQFDLVILNSVVQYFPNVDYLRRALQGAVAALDSRGVLFVGDVRSLPLLETFHASVGLEHARSDGSRPKCASERRGPWTSKRNWSSIPSTSMRSCHELPQLSHADVLLKRGRDDNEMTRYRYDVFLYMGAAAEPVKISTSLDWTSAVVDIESLERLLEDGPAVVEVLGIPNARVHADEMRRQLLGQGEGTVGAIKGLTSAAAIEPEDLWALGERQGYAVRVTWSRDHGVAAVDALFERPTGSTVPQPWAHGLGALGRTEGSLANNPLQSRQRSTWHQRYGPTCRRSFPNTWSPRSS